ncbi:sugar fermentation stimulation protein A [Litoreibacter meonggei]|uniref:Sugar fermentation stimulation protein homolog n=1 Tax=Litoreibacter meonggei TaxID=1049199 RepID=A0A497WLL0_9RHOB|nr:DNA/RNA nuclease SfsA [Litoreibacter meonggei]RLJ52056.1 sugar fermentation stimulation protein A [Litoreibacter meonggei]
MRFQTPLVPARLIRRYKRFLADAVLEETGQEVTAHCPNPGAMLGLKDDGMRIWLEPNDDPKKKLKYGWRAAELAGGHFACIDTGLPNRVVKEALLSNQITELSAYRTIRPEVAYGTGSRVDFLLTQDGLPDAYVEVKSVTLRRDGDWAEFPDCVTVRGAKHLRELTEIAQTGARAVMLYLVSRTDCRQLRMAADLDPTYAQSFDLARANGVEMLCYSSNISANEMTIDVPLPVDPAPQSRPRVV